MSKVSLNVITGTNMTFSYVHVFEPTKMSEMSKAKYSVSLVIPKSDTKTIADIRAAIQGARDLGLNTKFGGKPVADTLFKNPLRDGDLEKPDDPVYAGCYFVNAKSDTQPGIVDANVNPILDPNEFYSGVKGRASLSFYPYNFEGSKGVAVGLNNVQKVKDGERLSGGPSAQDDFGAVETGNSMMD